MVKDVWAVRLLLVVIMTHCGLVTYSAWTLSATIDEPAHLTAGWYIFDTGQCDLYAVNPPLVKAVSAIPLLFMSPDSNWRNLGELPRRAEFRVGVDFVEANRERFHNMLRWARLTHVPLSILGAVICYIWAKQLFDSTAGLAAATLWCFSPNIIGHGSLITADMPSAAVGILAGYILWKWLKNPSWENAVLNGVCLGLCWLTKLTWIILPGIWIIAWFIERSNNRHSIRQMMTELLQGCVAVALGVLVLNMGYGFEDTCKRLGDYRFDSDVLAGEHRESRDGYGNRFSGHWSGSIRVPLPAAFVSGIDCQRQDFEDTRPLYFAGERSRDGWWYFYLASIWLKETPGVLILGLISIWTCFRRCQRGGRPIAFVACWLPPLVLLCLVSSQPRLNYYRYLMPAMPFAFVFISNAFCQLQVRSVTYRGLITLMLGLNLCSGLLSTHDGVSYVNVFARSVRPGDWWFADGNYDWGQGMNSLSDWIDNHPEARPMYVADFHPNPLELSGISDFEKMLPELTEYPLDQVPPTGWYAISTTHLRGVGRQIHPPNRRGRSTDDGAFTWFQTQTPVDSAGRCFLIYRIEGSITGQVDE